MTNRFLLISVLALLVAPSLALAVPKQTPCRPNKTNICVPSSTIPKSFRTALGINSGFLAPLRKYPAAELGNFPEDSNLTPNVLIPALTKTIAVCRIVAAKFECTTVTQIAGCPGEVQLQDRDGGSVYQCQVECGQSEPDANGNCECDILYNTCK